MKPASISPTLRHRESQVPAGRARATGSSRRHQKSVGNVATASLCFDKRGSNRLTVGQKHFSPLGDDDKGSEGSRRREWAFVSVGVLECNG